MTSEFMDDKISKYDPTRNTVGAIYRDAQLNGEKGRIECGDMTNELMSSLVCDLNDTINSDPYKGRPFYITVHESKDTMMPRAIRRRILTTLYRPYPEDDTLVFYVDKADVRFCWCLPHWSEMDNMLKNSTLFEPEMIEEIHAWKSMNLWHFGFKKGDMGKWIANDKFIDKNLNIFLKVKSKVIFN